MSRFTDFRYIEPLHLRREIQGHGRWMIVDRDYPFVWEEDQARWYRGTVPADMDTDLASIPQVVQWLLPKLDTHVEAAVVHDYLYRNPLQVVPRTNLYGAPFRDPAGAVITIHVRLTRRDCDRIFLAAMRTARVPAWKRGIMYLAVRVGAWWAFPGA